MIVITSLAPRNGVYTVPQHTYERSLWRTWIFRWLKGRYDSLLDGSGYGGHVSGGTIGKEGLQLIWVSMGVMTVMVSMVNLMVMGVVTGLVVVMEVRMSMVR